MEFLQIALALSLAGAPEAAVDDTDAIDEVLVSATRRPARTDEITTALSVITGEAAREQKLLTDALASDAGVFLQQTTPGQGAAIIRGLKGSAILHLVDGMRLNNAIFRSAPTQYLALVPVSAVERIEVLRGTPVSLYGTDAIGGAVQVVTSVPRFESDETKARSNIALSFDSAELSKSIRGTIEFGNSRFATSLAAEYLATGNRRVGGGERIGPSSYESRAARALLAGTPYQDLSWILDIHYLEQPETPRVDELVPGFGENEPSSSEFVFAPNRRTYVHGRVAKSEGPANLDWNIDVAWQRIDDDRVSRDFGSNQRRFEDNNSDLYGITISVGRSLDQGSWIVGGEYYVDFVGSRRQSRNIVDDSVQVLAPRFPDGSEVRQGSVYGNFERKISARHRISGGLRFSDEEVSLPGTLVSAATIVDASDLGGDLGWLFDVSDTWQLAANVGNGFRSPNVFDLGTLGERPGNRFNVPNTSLDSEHVVHTDIGARYRSDRTQANLVIYTLEYRDRITSVSAGMLTPDGRDIVQSVNAARSRIHGFEGDASVQLTSRFSVRGKLSYTWGEQRVQGSAAEAADRMPPLTGRVYLNYEPAGRYSVESWAEFASEQNRLSVRDVGDTRIDPNGTAGWATINTRIRWDDVRSWQVTLGLDNVFDKRYRVHGSGVDAPGRNIFVRLHRSY